MTKRHKLVKKRCKSVNLSDQESQTSEKRQKYVNLGDSESQTSENKTQKCKSMR